MSGRNTDSFFKEVGSKWTGPVRIWIFFVFMALVVVGTVFFAEDTWSSYQGILALEQQYELNAVTWEETYWAGAVVAQLLQMTGMYLYLTNPKQNRTWGIVAVVAFFIDFSLDAMYRANGYVGGPERMVAIGVNTMIFSALSEVLITVGIGAALTLAPGAIYEFLRLFGYSKSKPTGGAGKSAHGAPKGSQQNKSQSRPPQSGAKPSQQEIERKMEEMRRAHVNQ